MIVGNMTMPIREMNILHKRKERFHRLFKDNKLPFKPHRDMPCHCCGKIHEVCWLKWERVGDYGKRIIRTGGVFITIDGEYRMDGIRTRWEQITPIPKIEIEGELLCRRCFAAKWIAFPWSENLIHPGAGSPHSAIPRSQMNYDGGRFNAGEW